MDLQMTGLIPIIIAIIGVISFFSAILIAYFAYRLGRVEGELAGIKRFYKASPEGIAINETLENGNARIGRQRFENDDRLQMVRSIRSQIAWLEEHLDTENHLLEIEQERNHKIKDLLTRK